MAKKREKCFGKLCFRDSKEKTEENAHLGTLREHWLESKYLGMRKVLVHTPPGYSDQDNWTYPFAILQDGQNVFDTKTAVFGVEWGVDETAEKLILDRQMEPIILVAVYNSDRRIEEYTPFTDPDHGGGEGPLYKAFLLEEVIPFLEKNYRVSRRAEQRAVIGSSLGGLASLYLAWTEPKTFGLVAALSPSLWWSRRRFLTSMGGDPTPKYLPKIWLDAGTDEVSDDDNLNEVSDLIDDIRTLRAVLLYHGYQEGENLAYHEVEGGQHDESSWSQRVGEVLKFLFPLQDRPI